MPSFPTAIRASLGLLALALAQPARATVDCDLKTTRDGFVVLRAQPGSSAAAMMKLNPATHYVRLAGSGKVTRGWAQAAVHLKARPGEAALTQGWVYAALLDVCG